MVEKRERKSQRERSIFNQALQRPWWLTNCTRVEYCYHGYKEQAMMPLLRRCYTIKKSVDSSKHLLTKSFWQPSVFFHFSVTISNSYFYHWTIIIWYILCTTSLFLHTLPRMKTRATIQHTSSQLEILLLSQHIFFPLPTPVHIRGPGVPTFINSLDGLINNWLDIPSRQPSPHPLGSPASLSCFPLFCLLRFTISTPLRIASLSLSLSL